MTHSVNSVVTEWTTSTKNFWLGLQSFFHSRVDPRFKTIASDRIHLVRSTWAANRNRPSIWMANIWICRGKCSPAFRVWSIIISRRETWTGRILSSSQLSTSRRLLVSFGSRIAIGRHSSSRTCSIISADGAWRSVPIDFGHTVRTKHISFSGSSSCFSIRFVTRVAFTVGQSTIGFIMLMPRQVRTLVVFCSCVFLLLPRNYGLQE